MHAMFSGFSRWRSARERWADERWANERWADERWADDRGDVPGWVLITLMTAGLVIIIWGLAGPALSQVFEQAIERVTNF